MVWSFQYEPSGSSYPNAEIVEGHKGGLEVAGLSALEQAKLGGSQGYSGWRIKPESVPKVIRFLSKRPLQDFENQYVKTVSNRLRARIEELEPNVHQFENVEFIAKDGSRLGERWFWQICNRLDTVDRNRTDWVLDKTLWRPPERWDKVSQPVFDLARIGDAKFWHDVHLVSTNLCSDEARERLEAAKITGLRYSYRKQA